MTAYDCCVLGYQLSSGVKVHSNMSFIKKKSIIFKTAIFIGSLHQVQQHKKLSPESFTL